MAWSPVTWAFKDLVTSSKLAQMQENIAAHDHRADGTQGAPMTELNVWRQMGAVNTLTNPTSWAVLPVAADRTAATMTFTKQKASSGLMVSMHLGAYLASGAAQYFFVGLRIGGTDYQIANSAFTTAAPLREQFDGHRLIAGISAGAKTIEPVVMSAGASSIQMHPGPDMVCYTVREVY